MHLFLWAEDSEADLRAELAQAFVGAPVQPIESGLIQTDFQLPADRRLPALAFARQCLPYARPLKAESIRDWAGRLLETVAGVLPDDQPWSLHIEPHYAVRAAHRIGARAWHSAQRLRPSHSTPTPERGADAAAGQNRCRLIREALKELLQRKRRHLLRQLRAEPAPFLPNESMVQLLLTSPEAGFISVAPAPLPFEQRHVIAAFPKGEIPLASDKAAPSRAFAKLVEAELRLGRSIQAGETCVDLGASPGSWTYVAASRGARVLAVDRSPLRDDLMANPLVTFEPGDAFRFAPPQPVDWLVCDVIAAPERSAQLLLDWLSRGWCRRFVVTIKLKDTPVADVLAMLKRELPTQSEEWFLSRLCANKKEVCAFGCRKP